MDHQSEKNKKKNKDNDGGCCDMKIKKQVKLLKTGDSFTADQCSVVESYLSSLEWHVTVVARVIVDGKKQYPIKHIKYM